MSVWIMRHERRGACVHVEKYGLGEWSRKTPSPRSDVLEGIMGIRLKLYSFLSAFQLVSVGPSYSMIMCYGALLGPFPVRHKLATTCKQ